MSSTYDKVIRVIKKKPSQRQDFEITELLPWLRKKSKLFATLKTDYLKDIVRNCSVKTFKKDDIIITQGDIGDCFYIILDGKISIFIINKDKDAGDDGDEKAALALIGSKDKEGKLDRSKLGNFVCSLGSGIPFGEVALVSEDAKRTATIIGEDPVTDLLVVDRNLYNRAVRDVLAAEFEEKTKFVREDELFSSWMPKYKKQLTMALYKEIYPYDAVLVKQGEPVENIYFIISGQVEVRSDPSTHPAQYPKLYKLLESERDKLVKEKRKQPEAGATKLGHKKTRENAKAQKMCYLGVNESIGELEVLMGMKTSMTTVVCTEKTEVLVLEMKHYERLFVKRHQRTIESMRKKLEVKLNTRSSLLKEPEIVPLLKLIQLKLYMIHNTSPSQDKKKKQGTSVQSAERMFFNHQGPLLDNEGPGSVFYMIRAREASKRKLRKHQMERQKGRSNQHRGRGGQSQAVAATHMHSLRLPPRFVVTAEMAGASGTELEQFKRERSMMIENVGKAPVTEEADETSENENYESSNSEHEQLLVVQTEAQENCNGQVEGEIVAVENGEEIETISKHNSPSALEVTANLNEAQDKDEIVPEDQNGFANESVEQDIISVSQQNSPTHTMAYKRVQSAKSSNPLGETEGKRKTFRFVQSATKSKDRRIREDEAEARNEEGIPQHVQEPVPLTHFTDCNIDENLRALEAKVLEWLRKDNPKASPNVAQLRRIKIEKKLMRKYKYMFRKWNPGRNQVTK